MDKDSANKSGFYKKEEESPTPSSYEGYDLTSDTPKHGKKKPVQSINWEASEYIHHSKGASWIVGLVIVAVVLAGLAVWAQAWTFAVLIAVMAVAMGVFAFRPPNTIRYELNHEGIRIGDKIYRLDEFRAFGVLRDGAFYTIILLPTKRFMPGVNIYFAEEQGEKIVDILGEHLPMEKVEMDSIEKIMRKLRF